MERLVKTGVERKWGSAGATRTVARSPERAALRMVAIIDVNRPAAVGRRAVVVRKCCEAGRR